MSFNNTIPIHSGLVCSYTDSTALVIDSLSGDRISSFSVTAAFSAFQKQQSASSPKIVFVAASPPYALTPAPTTASNKRKSSASFAAPSANVSAVLMIFTRVQEESNFAAIFVSAETGELLGMTMVPVPNNASASQIVHASLAPVFPSNYKSHRSLSAANKLAWVVHFSTGLLQVGVFDKKKSSTYNNANTTSLSQTCIAFAFSVDIASRETLLHHLESQQQQQQSSGNKNNNNNNNVVVLKEHSFNFSNERNAKKNSDDDDDEEENNNKGDEGKTNQAPNASFSFCWESQPLSKDAASCLTTSSPTTSSRIILLTDSRQAMNGKLACYAVTSQSIVCVTLTPEATSSYSWKYSPSSSSSSTFSLQDARLVEKSSANGSWQVGIIISSSNELVGICWIDFSSNNNNNNNNNFVPSKQMKESWASSNLSQPNLQQPQQKGGSKAKQNNAASNVVVSIFVSPRTSSPFEISPLSEEGSTYLARFVSSSSTGSSLLLQTNSVSCSSDKIVVDTTDINGEEDRSLSQFFNIEEENAYPWTITRDLVVADGNNNNNNNDNNNNNTNIIITLRVSSVANRAEMDLAEWLKFHVMGELLTKVAAIQPQVLFLYQVQQSQSKSTSTSSSSNSSSSSSRWPSPVLRVALRNLGGEVVKTLASGLINNFLLAAKIYKKNSSNSDSQSPVSFTFALASAVKVIETCVIMQRSLGVNFDSIVEPFCKKLEDLEHNWANTGTIGHRVASISALTTSTGENGGSHSKKLLENNTTTSQLYFDTKVGSNQQMNATVSTTTMDDVCLVVSNLKKQYNVPGDLF